MSEEKKSKNPFINAANAAKAAAGNPKVPGAKTSHYGKGNKASISVDEISKLLQQWTVIALVDKSYFNRILYTLSRNASF